MHTADGYKVVLAGRRSDALAETAALAGANSGNTLHEQTDSTAPPTLATPYASGRGAEGPRHLSTAARLNNAAIAPPMNRPGASPSGT